MAAVLEEIGTDLTQTANPAEQPTHLSLTLPVASATGYDCQGAIARRALQHAHRREVLDPGIGVEKHQRVKAGKNHVEPGLGEVNGGVRHPAPRAAGYGLIARRAG